MCRSGQAASVLSFWFEEIDPKQWFGKDDDFDARIRTRFGPLIRAALSGQLDDWAKEEDGILALILLLDQMPRNIYRNTPDSFAGDDRALAYSMQAVEQGCHRRWPATRVQFLLMPMMHAEDLAVQERLLPIIGQYCDAGAYDYAVRHRDIIARFGRFPHRNAILDRSSTEQELSFLKGPGSSF